MTWYLVVSLATLALSIVLNVRRKVRERAERDRRAVLTLVPPLRREFR